MTSHVIMGILWWKLKEYTVQDENLAEISLAKQSFLSDWQILYW